MFSAGLWSLRTEPPTAVQHRGVGPDAEEAVATHAPGDAAACTHQRHSRRAVVFPRTPFVAHLATTVGAAPPADGTSGIRGYTQPANLCLPHDQDGP